MKTKILLAALLLVVFPAITVYLVFRISKSNDWESVENTVAVAPRPAPAPPVPGGERVSMQEATMRTPYKIPIPSLADYHGKFTEVWVSPKRFPPEFHQVGLRYSDGLKISVGGSPERLDLSGLGPPFTSTKVNGLEATGKDARFSTLSDGTPVRYPASISWWFDGVQITLYHPTWSLKQLKELAESMPLPTWEHR